MIRTSDSQLLPDFTPGLGGITLESLQQAHHFCLLFLLCRSNGICPEISWCPQMHLSSRDNPPLDHILVALVSSPKKGSVSFRFGLINHDPMILQQQTGTTDLHPNKPT